MDFVVEVIKLEAELKSVRASKEAAIAGIASRDAEIERLRKELADREKLIGDLVKRVKPIPADWPGEALMQQMLLISDIRRVAAFLSKGETKPLSVMAYEAVHGSGAYIDFENDWVFDGYPIPKEDDDAAALELLKAWQGDRVQTERQYEIFSPYWDDEKYTVYLRTKIAMAKMKKVSVSDKSFARAICLAVVAAKEKSC